MEIKPCPFCQNKHTDIYDNGDACCFCDYSGIVTIGRFCTFSNLEQYNKIYYANSHQDRMDELHGRNNKNKTTQL